MDYAVIRTGGLQYRVSSGDVIKVPTIRGEVGKAVDIPEVLALSVGGELTVGKPVVDGAKVTAEVVGHGRGRKIVVYKKKRRKGYQRTKGHRQGFTELRITALG